MKALVQPAFGALELRAVAKPEPGDDEVLVRVHAASVGPWDVHVMRGDPYVMRIAGMGLTKPKQLVAGLDLAGRVEAVGEKVTTFQPGDEVYGEHEGSFATYTCAAPDHLAAKPPNLTFEQAAAVPVAGSTALIGLRDKGRLQPGQSVLIIGAAGGVGTFAVQIAKALGAGVTAVCSTRSIELVRSIGADHVIDYTTDDFASRKDRYDIVFQVAGSASLSELRRALTPKGTLVLCTGEGGRWFGPIGRIVGALVLSPFVGQTFTTFVAKANTENLTELKDLIESGAVTPVIDRTYPLSEAVEAVRYFEGGHGPGKVVLTV